MKWLILLLLIPTTSALQIAATPDKILLDPNGYGEVQLINPNSETIEYIIDGEKGKLDSEEKIEIRRKFRGNNIQITYRNAKGGNNIVLEPKLSIPIIRTHKETNLWIFLIVFLTSAIIGIIILFYS